MKRNRTHYALLIILSILLGLVSRKFPELLASFLFLYLGDTFWALMVFFILGFLWPRKSTLRIGILALGFSFAIEFSQLYHTLWIDQVRHTALGGLILGFGFLWSDLICYFIGIILGIGIDKYVHHLTGDESRESKISN